jgi:hypothetical protein
MDEDQQLAEALSRSENDSTAATRGADGQSATTSRASATQSATIPRHERQLNFTEADIQQLIGMGFPRTRVIEELTQADGNINQAIAALLAKSLQMP